MKLMIVFAMLAGCAFGQADRLTRIGGMMVGPATYKTPASVTLEEPIPLKLTMAQFSNCVDKATEAYAVTHIGMAVKTARYGNGKTGIRIEDNQIPIAAHRATKTELVIRFYGGQTFNILLPAEFTCNNCKGAGTVPEKRGTFAIRSKCPVCSGSGKLSLPAVHEVSKK